MRVDGLRVTYPGRVAPVLAGLSLDIHPGEFLAVTGPSGCGKTTFLQALAGVIPTEAGTVALGEARLAMVFQRPTLLPWRTVVDNVTFGLSCERHLSVEDESRAMTLLESVGLADVASRRPHELSEGMKQRVNMARALLVEPDVLLMDEPFSALDRLTRSRLQDDLLALKAELGFTAVMVSHAADDVARMADRVVVFPPSPVTTTTGLSIDLPHPRDRQAIAAHADAVEALLLEQADVSPSQAPSVYRPARGR